MADSQQVVKALTQRYEIFIATGAMEFPNSFGSKFRWLRRHFPFLPPVNFVFCGDKGIIKADYLIDDQPLHFRRFTGTGILYTAPHNLNVSGYRRVDNWQQIEQIFL
jgi:5'(3')-deoxyribonucleotidase